MLRRRYMTAARVLLAAHGDSAFDFDPAVEESSRSGQQKRAPAAVPAGSEASSDDDDPCAAAAELVAVETLLPPNRCPSTALALP